MFIAFNINIAEIENRKFHPRDNDLEHQISVYFKLKLILGYQNLIAQFTHTFRIQKLQNKDAYCIRTTNKSTNSED